MFKKTALASCLAAGLSVLALGHGAANAQEMNAPELSQEQLESLLAVKIRVARTLSFHPKLQAAVRDQNGQALSLEAIQQRDAEWIDAGGNTSLARTLQNTDAGRALTRLVRNNDSFAEAFLTDNQGANVAAYPTTSDYWQGDEEKWTASFNDGEGQVFVGPIEFDESTQTAAVQISAPVIDVDSKETLGVLVLGVKLDYLEAQL